MRQLVQDYHGHKGKEISSDKVDGAMEHYGDDYEKHIRDMYSSMGEELSDETLSKIVDNYDLGTKEEAQLKEPEVLSDEPPVVDSSVLGYTAPQKQPVKKVSKNISEFTNFVDGYEDEMQALNTQSFTDVRGGELAVNRKLRDENIGELSGDRREVVNSFKYSPITFEEVINHLGEDQDDIDEVSQQTKLYLEKYTGRMKEPLKNMEDNLPESVSALVTNFNHFGINGDKLDYGSREHLGAQGKVDAVEIVMSEVGGDGRIEVILNPKEAEALQIWKDLKSTVEVQEDINSKSVHKDNDFKSGLNAVAREAKDNDEDVKSAIIKYFKDNNKESAYVNSLEEEGKFEDYDTVVSTSLWNSKEKVINSISTAVRGYINEGFDTIAGQSSTTYSKDFLSGFDEFMSEELDDEVKRLMYGVPKSKYDGDIHEITTEVNGVNLILDKEGNVKGIRKGDGNKVYSFTEKQMDAVSEYNKDKERYSESAESGYRSSAILGKSFQVITDMIPIVGAYLIGGVPGLALGTGLVSHGDFYDKEFELTGDASKSTRYTAAAVAMTIFLESMGGFEGALIRNMSKNQVNGIITSVARKAATKKLTKGGTLTGFMIKETLKQLPEETAIELAQSLGEGVIDLAMNGETDLNVEELHETAVITMASMVGLVSVGNKLQYPNELKNALEIAAKSRETFESGVDEWVKSSKDEETRIKRDKEGSYKKIYVIELEEALNSIDELNIKNENSSNNIKKKAIEVAEAKIAVEEAKSEKGKEKASDYLGKVQSQLDFLYETSKKRKESLESQMERLREGEKEVRNFEKVVEKLGKDGMRMAEEFNIVPDNDLDASFDDKFNNVDDYEGVYDKYVTEGEVGEFKTKIGKLSEKPNEKGEHFTEGIVHSKEGEVVGQYTIYGDTVIEGTVGMASKVKKQQQGQGISTKIYQEVAKQSGKPVIPESVSRDGGKKGVTFSVGAFNLWSGLKDKGIAEEVYVTDKNGKTIKTLAVLPEGFESNENVQRVEDYTGENTANVEAETFTQEEEVESNFVEGTFTIIRNIKGKKIPQKLTFVKFNRDEDGNIISVSATNFKGKNKTVRSPEIIAQLEQDKILFDNKLTEEGNEITTEELEQATEESVKAGEVTTEESEAEAEESDKGDDGTIQPDRTGKDTKEISEEQEFEEGDRESVLGQNANYEGIFGKVIKREDGSFHIKSADGTETLIEGGESNSTNKKLGLTKGITKVQEVENIIEVKKERRKELRKKLRKLYDKVYNKVDPDSKSKFVEHIFGLAKRSPLSDASKLGNAFKGNVPAGGKESLGEELLSEVGPIADEFNNLNKELSDKSLKSIRRTARIADAARETKRIKSERAAKLKEFKKRSKAKKAPKEKVEPKPKSKPKAKKKSEPKKETEKKPTLGELRVEKVSLEEELRKLKESLSKKEDTTSKQGTPIKESKAKKLLNYLSKKYGILAALEDMGPVGPRGRYGTSITINNNSEVIELKRGTLFHEFLHPFVQILAQVNPSLYNEIHKKSIEAQKELGFEGVEHYDDIDKKEEITVRYLTVLSEKDKSHTLLNRFLDWISNLLFKNRKNSKETLRKLSADTPIEELYEVFKNYGNLSEEVSEAKFVKQLKDGIKDRERAIRAYEHEVVLEEKGKNKGKFIANYKNKIKTLEREIKEQENLLNTGEVFSEDATLKRIREIEERLKSINEKIGEKVKLGSESNMTARRIQAKADKDVQKLMSDNAQLYQKQPHKPIRLIREQIRNGINTKEDADALLNNLLDIEKDFGGELLFTSANYVVLMELMAFYRSSGYMGKFLETTRMLSKNSSEWAQLGHAMQTHNFEDLLSQSREILGAYAMKEQEDIDWEIRDRKEGLIEDIADIVSKLNLSEKEISSIVDGLPLFKSRVDKIVKDSKNIPNSLKEKGDNLISEGLELIRKSTSNLTVGGLSPQLIEGVFKVFSGLMHKFGGNVVNATKELKKQIASKYPNINGKDIDKILKDKDRIEDIKGEVEFGKFLHSLTKSKSIPAKSKGPTVEAVKIMIKEIKRSLPKNSPHIKKTPYEIFVEQVKNKNLSRSLLDSALDKVNLMKDDVLKAQLRTALNEIAVVTGNGNIIMKSSVERAINRGRIDIGTSLKDLVVDHYKNEDGRKLSLKQKIVEELDLTGEQARDIAELLDKEILKYIKKEKTDVLDKMLKDYIPKASKRRGYIAKMFDAIRLGAFTEQTLITQFAEKFGTSKLDADTVTEITDLMVSIKNEQNPHTRSGMERVLLRKVKNLSASNISRIGSWIQTHTYAALLSEVGTQLNAAGPATISLAMESYGVVSPSMIRKGKYKSYKDFRKKTKGIGFQAGIGMAIQAVRRGASNFSLEEMPTDAYSDFDTFMNRSFTAKGEWDRFKAANGGLEKTVKALQTGYYSSMYIPTHLYRMLVAFDLLIKSGAVEKFAHHEAYTQILSAGVNETYFVGSNGEQVRVERSSAKGRWYIMGGDVLVPKDNLEEVNHNSEVLPNSKRFNDELNRMLGVANIEIVKEEIEKEIADYNDGELIKKENDSKYKIKKLEPKFKETRLKEEVLKARNGDIREASHQRALDALFMSNEIKGVIPATLAHLLYMPKQLAKGGNPVFVLLEIARIYFFPIVRVGLNAFYRQWEHTPFNAAVRGLAMGANAISLSTIGRGSPIDSVSFDVISGKWKFNGLTKQEIKSSIKRKKDVSNMEIFFGKEGKVFQTLRDGITSRGDDGKLKTVGGRMSALQRRDILMRSLIGTLIPMAYMMYAYDWEEDEDGENILVKKDNLFIDVNGGGLGYLTDEFGGMNQGFKEWSIVIGGPKGFHVRMGDIPIGMPFMHFGAMNDILEKGGKVTFGEAIKQSGFSLQHSLTHGFDIGTNQMETLGRVYNKFFKDLEISMDNESWELHGGSWISKTGKKATLEQSEELDIRLDTAKAIEGYNGGNLGSVLGKTIVSRFVPRLYSGIENRYNDLLDIASPRVNADSFFDGLVQGFAKGVPVLSHHLLEEGTNLMGDPLNYDQDVYLLSEHYENKVDDYFIRSDVNNPVTDLILETKGLGWGIGEKIRHWSVRTGRGKYIEESDKKDLLKLWKVVFKKNMLERSNLRDYKRLVSKNKLEEANRFLEKIAKKVKYDSDFSIVKRGVTKRY